MSKSYLAFKDAEQYMVGGVNSPVRAFNSVGGNPIFFHSGKGAWIKDIDGAAYLDFVSSWGPLLFGHSPRFIQKTLSKQIAKATSFGAPTLQENKLTQLICKQYKNIDKVRLVNSGTEAAMSAIRLARAYTNRDKIIKFAGCYHGHADSFLIKAGSGAATLGYPDSAGVTKNTAQDTLIAEYNNIKSVEKIFKKYNNKIAAIILEPVPANMGVLKPANQFLNQVIEMTKNNQSLTIFDEVINGFRLAQGGPQEMFGVDADITILGKVIGGGLPVAAYGGRVEIMNRLSPLGDVYQAGTLSGNPLAVSVGKAMLKEIAEHKDFYKKINRQAVAFKNSIKKILDKYEVPCFVQQIGSILWILLGQKSEPIYFSDIEKTDQSFYQKLFHHLLREGIYFPPSAYEAIFVSWAHGIKELKYFKKHFEKAVKNTINEM